MKDDNFLRANNAQHLWHPMGMPGDMQANATTILYGAEVSSIIEIDGQKTVDAVGGLWCVNLGYSNDRVKEAIAEDLASLRKEIDGVRNLATQARTKAETAVQAANKDVGGALASAMAEVKALEGRMTERVDEVAGTIEPLRRRTGNLANRVQKLSEGQAALAEDLARLDEAPAEAAPIAAGGDNVKALRDALSTIISQNKEIKAQQDVLSAHFAPPVRVEVETSKRGKS